MKVPNSKEFVTALKRAVDVLIKESEAVEAFYQSNLVIRVHFEDIPQQITFDGRTGEVFWIETPGRADLELALPSTLFHEVMMGNRSLRKSITDGSIRIRGNVFRALSFADLLRSLKPLYQSQMKFDSELKATSLEVGTS